MEAKHRKQTIHVLLIVLGCYGVFAFVLDNLTPATWPLFMRFLYVVCSALGVLIYCAIRSLQ